MIIEIETFRGRNYIGTIYTDEDRETCLHTIGIWRSYSIDLLKLEIHILQTSADMSLKDLARNTHKMTGITFLTRQSIDLRKLFFLIDQFL
jgi:hypothetical protein